MDLDLVHPLRSDLCLHGGEGLGLWSALKDETQTSVGEATQPLISATDAQELADNEKHLNDAKVRENPNADWNAPPPPTPPGLSDSCQTIPAQFTVCLSLNVGGQWLQFIYLHMHVSSVGRRYKGVG